MATQKKSGRAALRVSKDMQRGDIRGYIQVCSSHPAGLEASQVASARICYKKFDVVQKTGHKPKESQPSKVFTQTINKKAKNRI